MAWFKTFIQWQQRCEECGRYVLPLRTCFQDRKDGPPELRKVRHVVCHQQVKPKRKRR